VNPIGPVLQALDAEIGERSQRMGRRVAVSDLQITSRRGLLELDPPGRRTSCNRACRIAPAADGWVALNLARPEDRDLVGAWLGRNASGEDPWTAVETHAPDFACAELVERAALLGLPAAAVGEVRRQGLAPALLPLGRPDRRERQLRVLDLSALWAGPMCGAILAAMGAIVTKVESVRRPDPTRESTPEFARRLNGRKMHLALDFTVAEGRTRLFELAAAADVMITGARPRAFDGLGLHPARVFDANPGLVWVAVTGYGWTGEASERVAFGDDAAAAGGLVGWAEDGPTFLGDALADPVTGMAAAAGALQALEQGGGVLVDAPLAPSAAAAAARLGLVA
jgi:hypothetical protein